MYRKSFSTGKCNAGNGAKDARLNADDDALSVLGHGAQIDCDFQNA
jgi:hypothetical protein